MSSKNIKIIKNIRIRSNSKSKQKEKEKLNLKINQKNIKTQISNEMSNISNTQFSSTTSSLKKLKINQKPRKSSIFFTNKDKKGLVIENKENRLKITNSPKQKVKQTLNIQESKNHQKNIPLRQLFHPSHQQQEQLDELPTPRCHSKIGKDIIKQKFQNELQNSKKFFNKQFQNDFLNYKNQCKKIFTEHGEIAFKIENQFSLTISSTITKTTSSAQTSYFSVQDKYFTDYTKYRKLKERNFNGIQDQQQKIKQILIDNQDLDKNYEQLIAFIQQGPLNDREKRVIGLSTELASQENHIQKAFYKIGQLAERFQDNLSQNILLIKKQKASVVDSIKNLLNSALTQTQKNELSLGKKVHNILQRTLNQVTYLQKLAFSPQNSGIQIFQRYNQQISKLQKEYDQFSKSFYQNRVLLYNCVKQIQKIPTLMVMLFGFDKEGEKAANLVEQTEKSKMQHRFEEYMTVKCEQCYHMKKKIKLLQFHNQKVKPVLKSLQWLIKDTSKRSCCLSIV